MARLTSIGSGASLPGNLLEDDMLAIAKDIITVIAANTSVIDPEILGFKEDYEVLKKLAVPYEAAFATYEANATNYETIKENYKVVQSQYQAEGKQLASDKTAAMEKRIALAIMLTKVLSACTDLNEEDPEQQIELDSRLAVLNQAGWYGGKVKLSQPRRPTALMTTLLWGRVYGVDWQAIGTVPSDPEIFYIYLDGQTDLLGVTDKTQAQVTIPDTVPAGNHSITVVAHDAFGFAISANSAPIVVA